MARGLNSFLGEAIWQSAHDPYASHLTIESENRTQHNSSIYTIFSGLFRVLRLGSPCNPRLRGDIFGIVNLTEQTVLSIIAGHSHVFAQRFGARIPLFQL